MGGRGSSSATNGVSSSLKNFSKATEQFNPASVQQPTIQEVLKGNITPKGGVAYSDFKKMSDDEKADVIVMAQMVKPPIFLDDSGMQRFAYFTGMSDKPQIVSDSQLDKMSGTSLYRTVNNSYNSRTDIGYTAKDIYKQIAKGDYTMYSDSGGSAHGKAIYFADSVGSSAVYSNGRNSIMMRAKISPNAKTISESALDKMYRNEVNKGTKLAKAVQQTSDRNSSRNLFALAKGYDVITPSGGSGYNMVLNRGGLVMSDKTKSVSYSTNTW